MKSNMLPLVFWGLLWVNECRICSLQPDFPLSFNFHFCFHFVKDTITRRFLTPYLKQYQGTISPGIPFEWLQQELLLSLSFLLHCQAQGIFTALLYPILIRSIHWELIFPVASSFYFFFSLIPETHLEDLAPFSGTQKWNSFKKTIVLYFQKTFFSLASIFSI